MFSESAELYDLIYSSFKNYEAESDQLFALLSQARPGLRTVLDVACGTAAHAQLLAERHGLEIDGVDLDPTFIEIAKRKHPAGRFTLGDMCTFDVGRRYDAVMCLFSSIGYVRTIERVAQAIGRFRAHLEPGGVIIVEPWLSPEVIKHGVVSRNAGEKDGVRVERTAHIEVDGRLSRLHFDYEIDDHGRKRHATEVHELGLFTTDEMRAAFEANDLAVEHDPKGLIGRGLYVAREFSRGRSS